VYLCEAFKNINTSKRGIFIITEKLGLFLQNVFGWGGNFKTGEGLFCKHIFLTVTPVKKCIYPKVSFEMYVLICVKLSESCENKGIYVISQKYKFFYASS
jgi:hypothetical protein